MLRHVTDEEIEQRVKVLRRELGLQNQSRPDLRNVIEKLTARFRHFSYQQIPDAEMPDAEAQWEARKGVLRIRESVVGAMQRGEPRARMMIANEIGHFAMRHSGVRNRSTTQPTAGRSLLEAKKEESEARRFAAMFLAPNDLLRSTDTVEDIVDRFGLSFEAAMIRKGEFDAFQRRASGHRRELPSIVVDYLKDAQRRGAKLRTDLN
ncbi:ImmA/IrrE family metallo-endopeptidase [Microvirga sp. VF16]|uniref:ImmA/IrrE family metallo-endopeptidase n=1 Tax=Microvirga sp. VF16 TaxID=2807101 RepID=UPI00193CA59F|nr:ImmA/IrrE family metallo-endopeptidase [Microvirga sp. VF16]QRM35523.1 ImmA/IrrE family metallo-endopeptidase [Microvirga sp. VF16]